MKTTAMVLNEYGENAKFLKSEIELPPLDSNQVLVEVKATSFNVVDNKIMRGAPLGPELPSPLHCDVAGKVVEVGNDVTAFKVGDEVFGVAGGVKGHGGASANHMVVNENLIALKPKSLSLAESAALPLVFVTAYEGLVEKAKLQEGQNLLVIGGAGGVGHQVVQLGKILGANVTAAVSSPEQADIAKSFGADNVINHKETPLEKYCESVGLENGFDVVFDTIGGKNLDSDWDLVRSNGQVVTTTSLEDHDLTPVHLKGISLHVVFMLLPMLTNSDQQRHHKILNFLAEKTDAGLIKPLIENKKFTMSEINEAHNFYENGKSTGKIVIENSAGL